MGSTISPERIGNAGGRKILVEAGAERLGAVEKTFEMIHRAGWQIVQHHQAPGLRAALVEGAIGPAVRIVPVARNRVPEHAAMFVVA